MNINVVKLKGRKCEVCGRPMQIICFRFRTVVAQEEYLWERHKKTLGDQAELIGEFLPIRTSAEFPSLFGWFIGYKKHDDPKCNTSNRCHNCSMSGKAPQNAETLGLLQKEVEKAEENPLISKPKDGDIATKRKVEPKDGWRNGQKKEANIDFFVVAAIDGQSLLKRYREG